jgi:long-chain fatty acid transport protein
MKKLLVCAAVVGLICAGAHTVLAGGAINKSNRSTEFMRLMTRTAATDSADIVTYNPAGTTQLEDGAHLNLSAQYLIEKDYSNEFLGRSYDSDEPSLIPSFFAVYGKGDWAGFFGFDIPLGGGKVDYENGNFTTYSVGRQVAAATNQAIITPGSPYYNPQLAAMFPNPLAGPYNSVKSHAIEAESIGMAYTLGGSYQINPYMSVAAGLRYVSATVEMSGSATNASTLVPVPDITNEIDFEADGDGWGGVLGVDLFPTEKTVIGFQYKSRVKLDFDYEVEKGADILSKLGIVDGGSARDDLPAEINLGVSHQCTPALRTEIGGSIYFNKGADIGGTTLREGLEENIDNSWEIGLGLEYAFSPALKASAGYLYSSMGVDPQYSSKFLPDLDAHTIGAGAAWSVLPQLVLNFAVGNVFYECDSYIDTSLGQDIEVKYDKNIPFVAAGIQYSF